MAQTQKPTEPKQRATTVRNLDITAISVVYWKG